MADKPRIIEELDDLIKQATTERSHYYVKAVAEKAQLAIGMLAQENLRLEKENETLKEGLKKIRGCRGAFDES